MTMMTMLRIGRFRRLASVAKCLGLLVLVGVVLGWMSSDTGDTTFLPVDPRKKQEQWFDTGTVADSANSTHARIADKLSSQDQILIYNRVPKCASTSMRIVIHEAATRQGVNVHISKVYAQEYLNATGQMAFIKELNAMNKPLIFIRHVFFVDFTQDGLPQPIYINMIRDPLDRLVSDYYFKRYNLRHMFPMSTERRKRSYNECVQGNHSECIADGPSGYFRIIPYFCGMDKRCLKPSEWALNQAKLHVDKYYTVVATIEHVSKFLEVLERLMPQYFTGSLEIYTRGGNRLKKMAKTNKKDPVDQRTIDIMKEKLTYDYDFYNYVQQQFHRQYTELLNNDRNGS